MDMTAIIALEGFVSVVLGTLACVYWIARPRAPWPPIVSLGVLFTLWWFSFGPMLVELDDWVHLYWAAQVPLVALFMISGPLLMLTCEGEVGRVQSKTNLLEKLVTPKRAPWWFLAMMTTIGFTPLLLIEFLREPSGYNTGEPTRRLLELARWGIDGAIPSGGVGPIPREATVSLAALLIAAWLWIGFCALAIVGRFLPSIVIRVFLPFAPLVLGLTSLIRQQWPPTPAWLDRDLFWGSTSSGVWRAEPAVLKSFGPVLLAAVVSAILLALVVRRGRGVNTPDRPAILES